MRSLSGVLRQSGHDIYQSITTIAAVSLIWFIIVAPGVFLLTLPFAVAYLLFTAMPASAGVLYAMKAKVERKPFSYWLVFSGIRKFYGRTFRFGLLCGVFLLILAGSWWYYLQAETILSFVVAIFQTYFCLFAALASLYTLPIMVGEDRELLYSLNRSIKLFLQNGLYTVGSLIQILAVGSLLAVTVVSVPLLFAGMLSVFSYNLYQNLVEMPQAVEDPE